MPKGMKTAPPQQSNLQEMWNGTKKAKAPKVEDAPVKEESNPAAMADMEVDEREDGTSCTLKLSQHSIESIAAPHGKRKPSPAPKEGMSSHHTMLHWAHAPKGERN